MEHIIKKEMILEGLHCPDCSLKIERGVNAIDGVDSATVNLMESCLTINIHNEDDVKSVLEKTIDTVKRIEPDVIVKDKIIEPVTSKALLLIGLCCEPCAAKIEKEVRAIDGIRSAAINFSQKKMTLEYYAHKKDSSIIKQAGEVAKTLALHADTGLKVKVEQDSIETGRLRNLIMLAAGIIVFTGAIISGLSRFENLIPSYINLALFVISYLLIGGNVVWTALRNIVRGNIFDEHFLMTIATIGAFLIHEYPEAVAVMLFYKVGEAFQDYAVNRSRKSIKALMEIRPDYAFKKDGDEILKVSPYEVKPDDVIIVKPGEKVPLDGIVIEGQSELDTKAVTGESLLKEIGVGDDILSGFINKTGLLTIKVTKPFAESTVSKILELVQNSGAKKSKTEKFISRFARYYTPAVVIAAALIAIIPPVATGSLDFAEWVYRSLIFLVISCPCALVISIPLGFFGGIGAASRRGILIKGSNYLDLLNRVDTIVFDKTGTITKGVFSVVEAKPAAEITQEELFEHAAYAEYYSNHPIARSILTAYEKKIDKSRIDSYEELSGHGIKAVIGKNEVLAGNIKLMDSHKIAVMPHEGIGSVVYIAVDKKFIGSLLIADEIKPGTMEILTSLKRLGIKKQVMLTGDSKRVADVIGQTLGLDEVHAELLPDQKVEHLETIFKSKAERSKVMFVGDGINDSPAIVRADVGVAMGALGSEAAIEVADIVLMNDDLGKIPQAFGISKRTRAIIIQNIALAFIVKGIVLALGALGLATMWAAVFSDVGVAILAILNAVRVINMKD